MNKKNTFIRTDEKEFPVTVLSQFLQTENVNAALIKMNPDYAIQDLE